MDRAAERASKGRAAGGKYGPGTAIEGQYWPPSKTYMGAWDA